MNEVRLIDANALKENIQRYMSSDWVMPCNEILKRIDNAPTVSPEKVKEGELVKAYTKGFDAGVETVRPQGEWIKWNFKTFGALGDWEYKCSNCEKVYGGEYNFCPNCGSAMQKGEHK